MGGQLVNYGGAVINGVWGGPNFGGGGALIKGSVNWGGH